MYMKEGKRYGHGAVNVAEVILPFMVKNPVFIHQETYEKKEPYQSSVYCITGRIYISVIDINR